MSDASQSPAILASMTRLWRNTQDIERMAEHSAATFWHVLPSLPMFLLIPMALYAAMVWAPPRLVLKL